MQAQLKASPKTSKLPPYKR